MFIENGHVALSKKWLNEPEETTMIKTVVLLVGFLCMIGLLTGCPSTVETTAAKLYVVTTAAGAETLQQVTTLESYDATENGVQLRLQGGTFKSATLQYTSADWPEVIEAQAVMSDSKGASKEYFACLWPLVLIAMHGYNGPTAVVNDDGTTDIFVPMGTGIQVAKLTVETDDSEFIVFFHGPAYCCSSDCSCAEDGPYTLSTSVEGSGTITPVSGEYAAGKTVSVTATPAAGWTFSHWIVIVDGVENQGVSAQIAQVVMNSDVQLVAVFTQNSTPDPDPTDTTGKVIIDLTASGGTVSFKATAPDGYAYAVFGGIGTEAQIQSLGLQLYYEAAVNGLWTDRQTFTFSGWPCTGNLTKVSGHTLRFEAVANTSGGWGDPLKLVVRLNGNLVPRVANEVGQVAYQVDLP